MPDTTNLSNISATIKDINGERHIWDSLRRRWLVCTPEEEVRQYVIGWLVSKKGVPQLRISQEYPVNINGQHQRAEIVVVDDFAKLLHKQNKGLSSLQKLLLQLVVAAAYVFGMAATGNMDTTLELDVLGISWDMGVAYYGFAVLLILAMVNSTNLTDGLDGLASSVTLVAAMCFSLLGFLANEAQTVVVSASLIGAMIGFLCFNYHPAKVFMGDTGSLFFGALIASCGLTLNNPLLVTVICGVFFDSTGAGMR